jgi:hypothetical protein
VGEVITLLDKWMLSNFATDVFCIDEDFVLGTMAEEVGEVGRDGMLSALLSE